VDDDELKGRMNDDELKGGMDGRIIYKIKLKKIKILKSLNTREIMRRARNCFVL